MKKWNVSIILLEIIYGIALLLLSITNNVHNLFDFNIKNQTLGLGIFFIAATFITFYYLKIHPDIQAKHPNAMIYGLLLVIIGIVAFVWNLTKGLSVVYFSTGYFLMGSLVLTFHTLLGLILIIESYQVKSKTNSY
ncbi:MAG: hypothetical protein HWN66_09160 [Candidatus Helarchaeota archaeon]|nr:hypothetical protein [Candidatus Helarchaeota archaeon]